MNVSTVARFSWADFTRVIAIYGVLLIHSCGFYFYQYGNIPLPDWLSANFIDSFSRCAVPIFVMLSGALLLKPGLPLANISDIAKRVLKVLIPLVIWSYIYLLYLFHNRVPIEWLSIFSKPAMYHLWFIYMIIGIYLLMPIFQALYEGIRNRRDLQIYLLCIWLLVTSITLYWSIPILSLLKLNSLFGYGGYFLLGRILIDSDTKKISTEIWSLIFFCSILVTCGLTWHWSAQVKAPIETAYVYFTPNVFVSAVSGFIILSRIQLSNNFARIFHWISDKTFTIFFVHVLVLEIVRSSRVILFLDNTVPVFFIIIIISGLTFLISLIIAATIYLVPGAKRVFG